MTEGEGMASANRPGGRQKHVVSGGGNAYKRGGGLGSGPVGGGHGGGFSAGGGSNGSNRAGGGGGFNLLALIIALIAGKSVANGQGVKKRGCLGRIIVFAVVFFLVYYLVNSCTAGGGSSSGGLFGGGMNDLSGGGSYQSSTLQEVEAEEPVVTAAPVQTVEANAYENLFTNLNNTTTPVSTANEVSYKDHTPNYDVDASARERYCETADNVTVMIYMCGTDLESSNGMATADLSEMVKAKISDDVNVIVETGGCSRWQNSIVKAGTNQIYQVKTGGLNRLESNLGKKAMTKASTLSEFIRYCADRFPADRNILILWDHGGGSISGYGYDELFPNGTMPLDQLSVALRDGGVQFDIIGFDACLMATLENALVCEPYADYLLASEATEPGTGWYYTNFLTKLSADTAMSSVDLGKQICNDFVKASQQQSPSSPATLSLIDLAELAATVPQSFATFASATGELVTGDDFNRVSDARAGAKDFSSSSKINQIDLIDFADKLDTAESNAFAGALRNCVKYNRTGKSVGHAYGVSIYFPYQSLSKVSSAINTYDRIGIDESYTDCIKSFASLAAAGSVTSGGSMSPYGTLMGNGAGSLFGSLLGAGGADTSVYSSGSADMMSELLGAFLSSSMSDRSIVTGDADSDWIDAELLENKAQYLADHSAGFAELALSVKNGQTVLEMSEEQWAAVRSLEQNVFLDDGEGFLDLGLDNVMEWTDDGDLLMEYDGTWMSLNGQIVAYYFISMDQVDDGYTILGRVPAILTKADGKAQRVNLILSFTDENPDGELLGAQPDYEGTTDVLAKGFIAVEAGDTLDFVCDYYGYDGTFLDSYYLGERMTVPEGEWVIGNAYLNGKGGLDGVSYRMTYRMTDAYGAQYWTPAVQG